MIDLIAETTKLDAAKQRLETAKTTYSDAQRALLASDGRTPIYDATGHASRTKALQDTFQGKVDAIDAQVDAIIGEIEKARLNPFADPLAILNMVETETAVRHREFIREDCLEMDVADLTGRLQWVKTRGDKGLITVYSRYASKRFKALLDAKPQPDGLSELRAALENMGAIGNAKGLSPDLQELRFKADAVKRAARYALEQSRQPTVKREPRITL